jgi:hypothetical protein
LEKVFGDTVVEGDNSGAWHYIFTLQWAKRRLVIEIFTSTSSLGWLKNNVIAKIPRESFGYFRSLHIRKRSAVMSIDERELSPEGKAILRASRDPIAVGLGFSALARRQMIAGGIFCAIAAFFLMVACEWSHSPFLDDGSFVYFLTHLHKVDNQMTMVLIGLGVALAFWFGRGR